MALSSLEEALPDLYLLAENDIPMGGQPGNAMVYNLEKRWLCNIEL